MIKVFFMAISTLLCVGCVGQSKLVSSEMIADTTNLFFSGVMNVEAHTFTDCSTSKTYRYDIGVQNSRAINSKITNALHANTKELYCKLNGRLVYDPSKDANILIVENTLSLSRLEGCGKPILPGEYISNNTYKDSYTLILKDDYTYTLEFDGEEVESGTWGKVYEFEGVMTWHSTTDEKKNIRLFTIEYLSNSVMVTLYYNNNYLIFS